MSDQRKAGMLGMAMALGAMNMLAPAADFYPTRKPKPAPPKPKNTKAAAQRKARKINRRNRK